MFKFIFITLLLLVAGYLFSPYITELLNYFNTGLNYLIEVFSYIAQILGSIFNAITQYNYIIIIIFIFLVIQILFNVIDNVRG